MMFLYDDEAIGRAYINSIKRETAENTVMRLLEQGKLSVEEIAACVDLSLDAVKKLVKEYKNNSDKG